MEGLRAALKENVPGPTKTDEFSESELKVVEDLKKVYIETILLEIQMQHDIYALEKKYEPLNNAVYDLRKCILDKFRKQEHGDTNGNTNVKYFWLRVLQASYTEFIGKEDERILRHLVDVRTKHYHGTVNKFVIEFTFEINDYFTNPVLTKTYILNCEPDAENPMSYDGAEIVKCEGCKIDWIDGGARNVTVKDQPSFFDFFNPPELPDPEHSDFEEINTMLENDFELGFYLKERVIPKAILFFTGEIADCHSSEDTTSTDSSGDSGSGSGEAEEATSPNEN